VVDLMAESGSSDVAVADKSSSLLCDTPVAVVTTDGCEEAELLNVNAHIPASERIARFEVPIRAEYEQ
jgi:hypothetical protein